MSNALSAQKWAHPTQDQDWNSDPDLDVRLIKTGPIKVCFACASDTHQHSNTLSGAGPKPVAECRRRPGPAKNQLITHAFLFLCVFALGLFDLLTCFRVCIMGVSYLT